MVNAIRRQPGRATACQGGWVLLALLFILAALGTGMAALGTVWTTVAQREKEAELLFVGEQYRRAIESYQRRGEGPARPYPPSLEELLQDRRFPMPVRHLRRLYPDPMTGRAEWGLVRDTQGGIVGVHSLGEGAPLKVSGFGPHQADFAGSASYRDWVFRARPPEKAAGQDGPRERVTGGVRPTPPPRPPGAPPMAEP